MDFVADKIVSGGRDRVVKLRVLFLFAFFLNPFSFLFLLRPGPGFMKLTRFCLLRWKNRGVLLQNM